MTLLPLYRNRLLSVPSQKYVPTVTSSVCKTNAFTNKSIEPTRWAAWCRCFHVWIGSTLERNNQTNKKRSQRHKVVRAEHQDGNQFWMHLANAQYTECFSCGAPVINSLRSPWHAVDLLKWREDFCVSRGATWGRSKIPPTPRVTII
jgi:hypothetical protein